MKYFIVRRPITGTGAIYMYGTWIGLANEPSDSKNDSLIVCITGCSHLKSSFKSVRAARSLK